MFAHRPGLAVSSLLVVLPATAGAEVLTFAMEGPITFKDDRLGLLNFAEVGQRVVYTFSFDTESPDSHPSPARGTYMGLQGQLRVGDSFLPADPPLIVVQEHDLFSVRFGAPTAEQTAITIFTLSDQDHIAIKTAALPTVPYDLSQFESKYFQFTLDFVPPQPPDVYFTRLTFGGDIDRLYLVPEPACVVMVGLGLMMCRRRRR